MRKEETVFLRTRVLVIGSGCAGLCAADRLASSYGRKPEAGELLLVTEGMQMGTSRNTGSDKQTYYKLGLSSDAPDSVLEMAKTLFGGRAMQGDLAYVEAVNSPRAFLRLVELGVDFPTNSYGEFVGYRTDHDTGRRATSAGPLTSREMTEALERSVTAQGVNILDGVLIFRLVTAGGRVVGALGWDKRAKKLTAIRAEAVVLATGGPAALWRDSVYPPSQSGMSGMALAAGARSANLPEWQYGLASVDFRWNVSGTYQQVLPRYISVDKEGKEREFVADYFAEPAKALGAVFRKGYEWPFDAAKLDGSSRIDLLVSRELALGRRVYLDYRREPRGYSPDILPDDARDYLAASGALALATPLARLKKMNPRAVALYAAHGIDLAREPLRIAVCAQHNNGGIAVDAEYRTTLPGLWCIGEAAGVFGVCRPGGTALNSTQVGGLRAAESISRTPAPLIDSPEADTALEEAALAFTPSSFYAACSTLDERRATLQRRMSECAGFLRNPAAIALLLHELEAGKFAAQIASPDELPAYLRYTDSCETARHLLRAMLFWCEQIGARGGAVCGDREAILGGIALPVCCTAHDAEQLCTEGEQVFFEPVRPIPQADTWFERVWGK